MINYFIIRLGADSENEIRKIDAIESYSTPVFSVHVRCKQVPKNVANGDLAIIWLGTNNNKGGKTPWVQGIRALGQIESVTGDEGYAATKDVSVSIGVVLPKSVTKMSIAIGTALYASVAAMPVLGVNNYSSQVVQQIDSTKPAQSMGALFNVLEELVPGFKSATLVRYPELEELFADMGTLPRIAAQPLDEGTLPMGEPDADRDWENTTAENDDEVGLEKPEDPGAEIEVPFDPTKIDITAKPMTISTLEDRLKNNELDLTPDFQRQANVWDTKRKARLIESILLKIPLPSFYFSEDLDGGYAVVDGLQRLCAVFHFKNVELLNGATGAVLQPLILIGLQYLKELEGSSFVLLDRKFQRRIAELEITANIIRANTPSAVKFNVFARLNQGGMPLNAQEIRNAIFPGEWRTEVRKLAESKEFTAATDHKVRTTRQEDIELVLRYIALWQLGSPYRRPSNQTLDEFLNITVEQVLTRWSAEKWEEAGRAFYNAISATCQVLGKHAFRKSAGSQRRTQINRGLFEAELIVLGDLDSSALSRVVANKAMFETMFLVALVSDSSFIQALLYATGSAEASGARIEVLTRIVKKVVDA